MEKDLTLDYATSHYVRNKHNSTTKEITRNLNSKGYSLSTFFLIKKKKSKHHFSWPYLLYMLVMKLSLSNPMMTSVSSSSPFGAWVVYTPTLPLHFDPQPIHAFNWLTTIPSCPMYHYLTIILSLIAVTIAVQILLYSLKNHCQI